MNRICVLGLGYIGLPTAAILASRGCDVIGVDINENIVQTLNKKKIHIEEPFLEDIVKKVIEEGRLMAKLKPESADVFIITVPTPKKEDNSCDLSYVENAIQSILPYLKKNNVIIIESTIPPGTTEEIIGSIIERKGFIIGKDIYLSHCPERVLPGKIIEEIVNNDRIIGGCTAECAKKASMVYESFVKGKIILTNASTAEMTKLMENTFRDVNIALANELVKICNKLQINAMEVIKLANKHPRVNILQPGPGVGGHCLAVDPYFIISKVPEIACLIFMARNINCSMPSYIVSKLKQIIEGIENPKIAVFGITYKENIDDLRESPALEVIKLLKKEEIEIAIYDPHVKKGIDYLMNIDRAVEGSDMILILVAHNEFKKLDYNVLAKKMRNPIIFDTKNAIDIDYNNDILIKHLGNIHDE